MAMFWPWLIYGLIVTLVIWVPFAILEDRAFKHPDREWTLSHVFATVGSKFPFSIFLIGVIVGGFNFGLAIHFWWHYCPFGASSG